MNSKRLFGKVLHSVEDKPLLSYLIDRIANSKLASSILIATSFEKNDDKIVRYCSSYNIPFYRGFLDDVAGRILGAAKHIKADAFVRINGDSPFIDAIIIDQAISIFKKNNYDLVTNVFPRSFPVGQSVEVIRTSTFEKAYQKMTTIDHFEHVTKYYYEHPDDFRIQNFTNNRDLSNYRLVVDTPEDLIRIEKIIGSMNKAHTEYSLNDLIELYPSA